MNKTKKQNKNCCSRVDFIIPEFSILSHSYKYVLPTKYILK